MTSHAQAACVRALQSALGDRVRCDFERLDACARDFGRMIHRVPAAVVRVHDVEELLTALEIGVRFGQPISTRGSGHSAAGQTLSHGAIVLDMKALDAVQLDLERGSSWLHAGASWQRVVDISFAAGWLPIGLTTIVDTTVGGTLSVGGIGSESFRTGLQVDQVLELEVATLDGKLERCSREHHRELFDAMRAGAGQCGVIVRALYPLRKAKPSVRTHTLVYDDLQQLLADMLALSAAPRCEFTFAPLLWSEQAGWQLLLMLGQEFEEEVELSEARLLSGMQYKRVLSVRDDPQWQPAGSAGHPFFRRYIEQNAGVSRPWVDHLSDTRAAGELIASVMSGAPVAPRAGTCGLLLSVAAHRHRAPLVMPHASGVLQSFSVFPEPSSEQLPDVMSALRAYNERAFALGAKRYMAGFLDGWGERDWSAHFGEAWPWFRSVKERFDPGELLNRGYVSWR